MSPIVCLFLHLTFSVAWSTAQKTISDGDNCDCSRFERRNYSPKRQSNSCPSGFNYTVNAGSKCYAVLSEPANWDNAQIECSKLDPRAHLTIINSALENQIISEILKRHKCSGGTGEFNWFWIGGRRENTRNCSSSFVWKSNLETQQTIGYANYCPLEPNCAESREHCLSFSKTCYNAADIGGWQDLKCSDVFLSYL